MIAMLMRNRQDSDIRSLHETKATSQPYRRLAFIPMKNFDASTDPANRGFARDPRCARLDRQGLGVRTRGGHLERGDLVGGLTNNDETGSRSAFEAKLGTQGRNSGTDGNSGKLRDRNSGTCGTLPRGKKIGPTFIGQPLTIQLHYLVCNVTLAGLFPFWNPHHLSGSIAAARKPLRMKFLRQPNAQPLCFHILAQKHPGGRGGHAKPSSNESRDFNGHPAGALAASHTQIRGCTQGSRSQAILTGYTHGVTYEVTHEPSA